ncbi:heavy metal translocating P-type ATPase [Polaromonas sp.]|uniref:heavy metal translocating P-type ATPase n=1 Tax=Polaromonas sp. TaxID=1869339 RepID=UPI0017992B0E|nr:heavy metal translocating P-type ATPase [Polaromonas sp.]NMM06359.1 heavy metal translocating P-type ATPase [Polaromonas sp.]
MTAQKTHDHDAHDVPDHGKPSARSHGGADCCGAAAPMPAPMPASISTAIPGKAVASSRDVQTPIRIMQMDCPTEEGLLRSKLGGMAGVVSMEFNLMQRMLTVTHDPKIIAPILAAVRSLGFTPELASDAQAQAEPASEPAKPWWPLALAGVAAVGSEAANWAGLPAWVAALLAAVAVLSCGLTTYKKGWIAIRNGNLNINALMSIAVTGAFVLGQWAEGAMVMVLFTVAELIEAKSLDRARNAIKGLIQLAPERATVLQSDGTWSDVAAKSVQLDAHVRVKPGERIALDGKIVSGRSSINQAPITGESLPVEKTEGDPVFAGTINESGSFEYAVTAVAGDSTLARIIHAVEAAQGARAPTQRFVDQFARIYTPVIFVIALAIAIFPPLLMGGDWFEWVYKALVLLVIACPCALVISTPVTIVSGLAAAARQGILIKGGVYLEAGRKLAWLALDKTGTLTHGKPVQTNFVLLKGSSEAEVRSLAASLASRSDHPVSRALADAAKRDAVALRDVEGFEALPGRGTKGIIDGKPYYVGNHRLIHELGKCSDELEARLSTLEQQGKTVILLADEQDVLGLFAVADTVKDSSRQAIAELHALGIKTVMLTGDNAHTAKAIAQQVGIDEARGDLLPEDKLKAIESKMGKAGSVGMVGDGINDAPALARADIGFAMGAAGTGTAIETADVALMDDDLRKLPRFVRLSRHTHALLVQNIALALGIKAVFLVLTLIGTGTMWMAVFADVGASLLVIANGLRLLRK